MEKLIATFEKNAREEIKVQLTEYKGHQLLDIRIFFLPADGGESRPTRRGITMSTNLIPHLKKAIGEAQSALTGKDKPEQSAEADEDAEAGEPEHIEDEDAGDSD